MIPPNAASLTVLKGNPSVTSIDAALREYDEKWDWKVRQISASTFSVIFPTPEMLRFGRRSAFLPLPENVEVKVGPPIANPEAVTWLQELWIKVKGFPEKFQIGRAHV